MDIYVCLNARAILTPLVQLIKRNKPKSISLPPIGGITIDSSGSIGL